MTKYRKIPKGWRILTPSEKIDASCMHNLRVHDDGIPSDYIQKQFALGNPECNGYINSPTWTYGTLPKEHPNWIFIKPKSPKQSVTVTTPLDTTVGTVVASGVESEASV